MQRSIQQTRRDKAIPRRKITLDRPCRATKRRGPTRQAEHERAQPPDARAPLSRRDLRTLLLASLGGALEFYDFIIFVFFAAAISHLFFPPGMPDWLQQLQTFGIFAAGYRPGRSAGWSWRISATSSAASACSPSPSS
ncbi:hypothetical protein [Teichococcus aestuarii]|uniref:hypothetical protein n=1 Tax=Teichococcus aestuarii TaxID=568898 RepID=UPI00360AEDB8